MTLASTPIIHQPFEFTIGGAFRVPAQVVLRDGGPSIFVGAKDGEVEVESRVSEVIRISAEESGLLFRREDESNIGVFLISIQPVCCP